MSPPLCAYLREQSWGCARAVPHPNLIPFLVLTAASSSASALTTFPLLKLSARPSIVPGLRSRGEETCVYHSMRRGNMCVS